MNQAWLYPKNYALDFMKDDFTPEKNKLYLKPVVEGFLLHQAVLRKNAQLVTELLHKGADLNFAVREQFYLLHVAAEQGNSEIIRIFIKEKK